ncbi:MAG: ATP-binding protein [Thermodesulfovibrionales bacterium]
MVKKFLQRIPLQLNLNLKFIIGCSLTLIAALGISFYIIAQRQENLIMGQVENEARVLFRQIVLTRKWIADHGGIFVEKLPWVKPTPYIKDSEIIDEKGKRYVRETPAMVTKELSRYSKDKGLYWFHITSLKLTNPENTPDDFERKALAAFEKSGRKEHISVERIENAPYLRYIAPLYVEEACLKCHAAQGYRIGDVRGAISITLPLEKTFADIAKNKRQMFISMVLIVVSLIAAMFLMMKNLVLTPMRKLKHSIKQFSEGKYDPESRLQTGDEFEDLFCAFSEMAGSLTEYHNCLNDKIRAATQDIEGTNKKLLEANKLLSETNARKSDFIARASHELRTPLTSIRGAMDYIAAKLSSIPAEKIADTSLGDLHIFFQVIKKNSERLIRMVSDMLDIERIEIGASEMHFTSVDLPSLVVETATNFHIEAEEKRISLRTDLPGHLPALIDEDRIRQVLTNLISNALKFSPAGSEIAVTILQEYDDVVTMVADNGPGIPLSEQEKIFEKFYKNGNKEGAGLGLAICKSIVEAHNGTIGVTSDGKSGSCFYFTLPFRAGRPQGRSAEERGGNRRAPRQKLFEITRSIMGPWR